MRDTRKEWVSLPVAARELGWSRQGVLTAVVRGDLKAQFIAGRTVISRDSVDAVLEKRAA
jgi:hypothetical protein